MPFLDSLKTKFPLPSLRDLENSHLELQNGPYPEFDETCSPNEERKEQQPPDTGAKPESQVSWITRLLARSPRAINEKREVLLSSSGSRRSSLDDLESQVSSTDASTLCDEADATQAHPTAKAKIDPRLISDAIIGLSDGLTVPFALTAGLSALGNTNVVIYAGLAELTAGAISMGLGGYLGAKSEEESNAATRTSTAAALATAPSSTLSTSTASIFAPFDLPAPLLGDLTAHLSKLSREKQLEFLMGFEHQLPTPAGETISSRALTCALTIAMGYFLGGFVPLLPYFFVGKDEVMTALWWSLGVMGASLFAFGYVKTCFVAGWRGWRHVRAGCVGGVQMVIVGGVAAGCAMGLVRLFHGFAV